MNKKQREALTALRDVMLEHDICVEGGNQEGTLELFIGASIVDGHLNERYDININTVTKLLEEQE